MRIDLLPAVLLPAGILVFGLLMLRTDESRLRPQDRLLAGRLAIIVGVGGLIVGLIRVATGS